MRALVVIVALCVLAPVAGQAHKNCRDAECEETKQKIRRIEAKMRRGYTRAQGEKMEAELRSLRAIRAKRCR